MGGTGLSLCDFALLREELGRSPLGHYVFNCQAPDVGNMEILLEYGTPEQQERFLKPLVAGKDVPGLRHGRHLNLGHLNLGHLTLGHLNLAAQPRSWM